MPFDLRDISVGVVGLGYVGLPLAVAFAKQFKTIGFDKNVERILELKGGIDKTREVLKENILESELEFTSDENDLKGTNFKIVAVPTPVDENAKPDLNFLISASELVGRALNVGDIVVFESTVYPGCTEEVCAPVLEQVSSLKLNIDFFIAYSPERINPGDKTRDITDIIKVVSCSDVGSLAKVSEVYQKVVKAGVYQAASIKVAEAAKVIENIQRDVNIALINELSQIFAKLNLNTRDVLSASRTKWNFLNFEPGLVGGHCIGVDPYYLMHKAGQVGAQTSVISSCRSLNESMVKFVAKELEKISQSKGQKVQTPLDKQVLVLGATFKENCPDLRNSKSFELIENLVNRGYNVDVCDPCVQQADLTSALRQIRASVMDLSKLKSRYDIIVLVVKHRQFVDAGFAYFSEFMKADGFIYDLKSCLKDPQNNSYFCL